MDKWRVAHSRVVLDRAPWLRVTEQRVELLGGGAIDGYLLVEERDVVFAFAITEDGYVPFVEQYKHGTGEPMWSLPAGYLDDDDPSPMEAAQRELAEETGYAGGGWTHLGSFVVNLNRWHNRYHYYLAQSVRLTGEQHLDPTEAITVHLEPVAEVAGMVGERIKEVGSVACALLALVHLGATARNE